MKHFTPCSIFIIFKHILDLLLLFTKKYLIISTLHPRWNKIHFCFLLHLYTVNWNNMALYRWYGCLFKTKCFCGDVHPLFSFQRVTSPPSQRCHCPYLVYLTNVGHPCMSAISEAQSNSRVWNLPLAWFMGQCDVQLSEGPPLSCYSSQLST